jgi:hypothetical protein
METTISELSFNVGLSKRTKRIFYYCLIVIIHLYMHMWLDHIFPESSLFRRMCFLTNISFYLNLIYYSYVLIMHVPYGNRFKHFRFLQAYFKFCYAISFVVFILYWGMIFADPSLLISRPDRKMLPLVLDLFLHGANFILNFIEHVFVFPKSDSRAMGLVFYLVFSIFYASFMKFLYHSHGIAVYPFVSKLGIIEFGAFIGLATFLVYLGDLTYRFFLKVEKITHGEEPLHIHKIHGHLHEHVHNGKEN